MKEVIVRVSVDVCVEVEDDWDNEKIKDEVSEIVSEWDVRESFCYDIVEL